MLVRGINVTNRVKELTGSQVLLSVEAVPLGSWRQIKGHDVFCCSHHWSEVMLDVMFLLEIRKIG